jgi:hypothetical protein
LRDEQGWFARAGALLSSRDNCAISLANEVSLDGDACPSHLQNRQAGSLQDAAKCNGDAATEAEDASEQHLESSSVLHDAVDKSRDESSVAAVFELDLSMRERASSLQQHGTSCVDLLAAAVILAVTDEEPGSIFNITPGFLCNAELLCCSFVCFNFDFLMQRDNGAYAAAAAAQADAPAVTASSEVVTTPPARDIVNQSQPRNLQQQQQVSAHVSIEVCTAPSQGAVPSYRGAVADDSNSHPEAAVNQSLLPSSSISPSSLSSILPASSAATETAAPKSNLSLRERMNM